MTKRTSPLRIALLALLVFAVGVAGVLAGSGIRAFLGRGSPEAMVRAATRSLLKEGQAFPDVSIAAGDPDVLHTATLCRGEGGVFLFLDLECPPCVDMSRKWQDAIDRNVIPDRQVLGITNHAADIADDFRAQNALTFRIGEDTGRVFHHDHRVQRFPLEVVVDASGRIRSTSYDSRGAVDPGRLAELLAN